MIKREKQYIDFLEKEGVGSNDKVASSIKSYISYLNSISKLIGEDISDNNLFNEISVENISSRLIGHRSKKTISNYKAAMRMYVKMVQKLDKMNER